MFNHPIFWSAAAVIISILAAGWTVYTNYKLSFSPCLIEVVVGNPIFLGSPDESGENYSLTPIIPIEFANVGARPGSVRDIVVTVSSGNWRVLLHAHYISKSYGTGALTENNREGFHPFMLNGKERIFKNLLFNPTKQPKGWENFLIKNGETLPDSPYLFKFYINSGDTNSLRLVCDKSYRIPKKVLASLAVGKGRLFTPLDAESIKARKILEDRLSK